MPFPYKKMTEEDFAYLRSVTAPERVWVGDEIAREYYHDEMPEYGVFPPVPVLRAVQTVSTAAFCCLL